MEILESFFEKPYVKEQYKLLQSLQYISNMRSYIYNNILC